MHKMGPPVNELHENMPAKDFTSEEEEEEDYK
jgi:hypothetical protein